MNKDPNYASFWKGRILTQIVAETSDSPKMQISKIDRSVANKCADWMSLELWEVKLEISQGICLPSKDDYKIMMKIGDLEIETKKPKHYEDGYSLWNQRFTEQVWKCPYKNLDEMADVYLYLMDDGKPICYWRGPATLFSEPNAELKWVPLTNDLAIGKIDHPHQAGMISFRLSLNN